MDCEYMRVGNSEESFMNGSSSWMDIIPMSHEEIPGISTLDKSNQVFAPSLYPIASLNHDEHLRSFSVVSHSPFAKSSYHMMMQNQDISGNFPPYYSSHCPLDSSSLESITRNPSLGLEDGSFSKLGSSFEMNQCVDIGRSSSSIEEGLVMDRNRMSEEDFRKSSQNERRVIHQHGSLHAIKDNEGGEKRYHSENTYEQAEEKEKYPQNPNANVFRAQKGTEAKIRSSNEEAPKENYTHLRARRGQATSSHSLAERVRREKISERMRLLQQLVPGCNKITGKAVMLDEIINYVQSLQQQVEFLSMKLATVRPHLAIDLETITSMHDAQSGVIHTSVPEIDCGTGSLHPYTQGVFQKSLPVNPNVKELIPYLSMIIRDSKLKMQDAGFQRQLEEVFNGRHPHI